MERKYNGRYFLGVIKFFEKVKTQNKLRPEHIE